jgi:hypothetical protein
MPDDPAVTGDEARATARLHEAGDAVTHGVAAQLPGWAVAQVERILDAWGRADADTRARAHAGALDAGDRAATRVVAALTALLGQDAASQTATPLEVVRSSYREVTEVLVDAGVPPVEREEFDERAWPDDRYGLVLRTLSDLRTRPDDEDLGPLLLVWGMAKAAVLRARVDARGGQGSDAPARG